MKTHSLHRLTQVITLAAFCIVTVSAHAVIVIGSGVRNGDFNDDTSATDQRTFADTPFWENIGTGDQTAQATRSNVTYDGTRNAVLAGGGGRIPGQDTGHDLAVGETFLVSYVWRDASGWDDDSDQVVIRLFVTDNDLIGGARTDIAEAFAPLSTLNLTYEAVVDEDFGGYSVPAGLAGKRLFLEIGVTASASEFARFDNLVLEATPSTVLTWVGGGGNTWDTSSVVWTNAIDGGLTNYSDGALVTFDDTSANLNVTLSVNVSPGGVTVDSANNYTLTGNGILTGNLSKLGSGILTFSSMINSYTGGTTVDGGTLQGDTASVQGDIANNATVVFDQAGSGTYAGSMSGSGTLIKSGAGTVSLTGANSYTGDTLVQAGRLDVRNTYSGGGGIQVSSGATLGVTDGDTDTTLNCTNLVFEGSNALVIDDGAIGGIATIIATPNFTNAGTVAITYSAGNIALGSITLIDYEAATSVVGGFTLNPLPAGYSGFLTTNGANSSIDLVITAAPGLLWSGTVSSLWDIGTTANWNGGTSTYTDGSIALFDDTGSNTDPIDVNSGSQVAPALMVVSNSTTPYAFSVGTISTPLLVKDGSGSMTFSGFAANSFTNVDLRAGSLTYSLGGSLVNETATFTGSGTLRQSDASFGSLILAGDMSGFDGDIEVAAGYLVLGGNDVLGTTNGTTTIASGATLEIDGFVTGAEEVIVSGTGVGGAGAIVNSGANENDAFSHVTLVGDVTFAATGRWDIRALDTNANGTLSTGGNPYNITKIGTGAWHMNSVDVDPALGDITVQEGRFGIGGLTSTDLGDPAKTITVWGAGELNFFTSAGFASDGRHWNKVVSMQSAARWRKAGTGLAVFDGQVNLDPGAGVTFDGTDGEMLLTAPVTGSSFASITKTGGSIVTLAGANTYDGLTTASEGTLKIATTHAGGGDFSVDNGASLGALVTSTGTTLSIPNLTLGTNGSGAVTLLFDFGSLGNPTAPVMQVSSVLTTNAGAYNVVVQADLNALSLTGGTPITLLQYPAGQFTNDVAYTLPAGVVGVVTNNVGASAVQMTITSVSRALTWVGNQSSDWDINTTTNWLADGADTVYKEIGLGDNAIFTDTASNYVVTVAQTVSPASVSVAGTNDYSIGGSFTIGGPATLTKTGPNTLDLSNDNTFTGGATLSDGRVRLGSDGALGVGAITLDGGALSSDSATARSLTNAVSLAATSTLGDPADNGALALSGPFDFVAGARDLAVNSDVTLSGTIVSGSLDQKTGPGTLTFLGITGTIDGTGQWQVEDGDLVVDGGTIDKPGGGIRITSRVTNGVSRIQIINGASLTNSANVRIGSAGGELTATNILDVAGNLIVGGSLQIGADCAFAQLNLQSGGLLRIGNFGPQAGGYTDVEFNGGTLAASQNSATFMEGLDNVTLDVGGVTIDTEGFDITIGQTVLNGVGGLTKLGSGTLTMTTPLTGYGGDTVVTDGTLDASGNFGAAVTVGAAGTITPRLGLIQTAQVAGGLTLGGTTLMEIGKIALPESDKFLSSTVALGGTLIVTNLGPTALQVGDSFDLFDGTLSGGFSSVILPTVDSANGNVLTWTDTLSTDGRITVASLAPPIVTDPPPALVNVFAGGQLQLSWGAEYTGYTLLSQTNALSVGLDVADWVAIPGSEATNAWTVPIDPANPTVFFQLVYTNTP